MLTRYPLLSKALSRFTIVTICLVVLLGFSLFFAPKSYLYNQYVCKGCGLRKVEDIRKLGAIAYHHQETLAQSAISRALQVKNCCHNWFLYRYGHTSKRLLASVFADGASPSNILPLLLGDDRFAQELARTKNPSKTWASLISALNSNPAFDDAFASWRQDSDRGAFSEWSRTNEFSDLMNK